MATTYKRKNYTESQAVTDAKTAWDDHNLSKPEDYTSRWQTQLEDAARALTDREAFRYDPGSDALYRNYRDRYINQGRMAMMDTQGRAAALTGGYGNSYAQTAGQQTYQNYLQQLSDRVPELYALALQTYQAEGDRMKNNLQTLQDREQTDYDRWRAEMTDWNTAAQTLYDRWLTERSFDYTRYTDAEDAAYQDWRDQVQDQQWQDKFDYQKSQDQQSYQQWLQEFEEDRRRYDQEWAEELRRWQLEQEAKAAKTTPTGSTGKKKKKEEPEDTAAKEFVDRMLAGATGSRFDPQRVIDGTNVLTEDQKAQAQEYLKEVLASGRMK